MVDGKPLASKKVLVVGAAGFIGSHIARAMRTLGAEVYGHDTFVPEVYGYRETDVYLEAAEARLRGVSDHIYTQDQVFDAVVWAAGCSSVPAYTKNTWEHFTSDLTDLYRVLGQVNAGTFIFLSSAAASLYPDRTSKYGEAKYYMEQCLRDAAAMNPDLEIVRIRPYNVVGGSFLYSDEVVPLSEWRRGDTHLVPSAFASVLTRTKLKIYDPLMLRDYVDVESLAECVTSFLLRPRQSGCLLVEAGSGCGMTTMAMASMAIGAMLAELRRQGYVVDSFDFRSFIQESGDSDRRKEVPLLVSSSRNLPMAQERSLKAAAQCFLHNWEKYLPSFYEKNEGAKSKDD